jgi:hypothetical protein
MFWMQNITKFVGFGSIKCLWTSIFALDAKRLANAIAHLETLALD